MPTPPRRPARRPAARPTALPGSTGAAATAAGIALVTAAAVAAAVPDPDAAALPAAPVGTVDTSDGVRRTVSVWAPPGLTRSPVAFTISPDGRLWVAESDRAGNAVTDTRQLGHLDAVWEDGQLRTVEDRRRLIERWVAGGHFEPDFFTRTEDRVRMLADADGDGTADVASVFAGGFDDAVDGIAAGVLWVDDALLFTNVPALWALRDLDGDGTVDEDRASGERVALSTGYGIRWCFYGHDLHGLAHGPDGRVWFTMGDRGYNVVTPDGERLVGSDRGAVFRCWPDGSGLELVHEGLRNPQELAFDALGRPFTGDNNCDSGDRARVTLVLEGADSGWRQDVQSLPSRGPWNREGMWHLVESPDDLVDPARPAWVLPPIAHVGAGPAGFALQPGTGESGRHAGTLMLVDFYGSGATVHSFAMRPSGAWMELEDRGDYYRGATVTDIGWGPDGRLYMTDWGGGWSPNPNGRVLVVTNEDVHGDPEAAAELAAVRRWLEDGPAGREDDALVAALDHADRRVRHAAQMELARRGGWRPTAAGPGERTDAPGDVRERLVARLDAAGPTTGDAGSGSGPGAGVDADGRPVDLGALHATWALGQVARRDPAAARALLDRRDHADPIVRAQVVRTLADLAVPAPDGYAALLADPAAPVRGFAIRAVGRTRAAGFPGGAEAAPAALLAAAAGESDRDPVIRHELVVALARLADPDALADRYDAEDAGVAARLAVVLAARRRAIVRVGEDVPTRGPRAEARRGLAPLLIRALDDASPRVSAAAARAIYDLNLGAPEPFTPLAADASGPPPVDATGPEAPSAFRALARSLASLPARRGHVIEPIVRRAIEANLRLGDVDPDAADRLVAFAAAASVPPSWRILALERVEAWAGGDRRERVWGHWIPRPARSTGPVEAALARHEPALLASSAGDAELRFRVDRLRARLLLTMSAAEVATVLADERRDPRFRAVLLEEAARRFPEAAGRLVTAALAVRTEAADVLRMAAMDVLAAGDRDPVRLLEVAATAIEDGTVRERQHAADHVGRLAAAVDGPAAPGAAALLRTLLDVPTDDAASGDPLAPIRLELHRAAAALPEGHPLRARAAALDARWAGRRPPGWGDELLAAGGDPRRGERIFRRHEAAQCLRCHAVRGSGAGMAGPALTAIATRRTIAELVEAVVEPGRTLVPGWGDVAAMPETTEVLTPAETRDVIAYLASLDDTRSLPPPAGQGRARRFVVGTGAHVLALGLAIAISVAAVRLGRGAA